MEKGKTNNPNGRPKGKPNKVTTDMKKLILHVLEDYTESTSEVNLGDDFKNLEKSERVKVALKMMEFVIPKLQRTTIEDKTEKRSEIDNLIANLTKCK